MREIIVGSVDVIIQAARLRDGSRRITHITEVIGMEGDVIITQDVVLYNIKGEDAERQADRRACLDRHRDGRISGIAPATYGEEQRLAAALESMEKQSRLNQLRRSTARCSASTRATCCSCAGRPAPGAIAYALMVSRIADEADDRQAALDTVKKAETDRRRRLKPPATA